MNKIITTQLELHELLEGFRNILHEVLEAHHYKQQSEKLLSTIEVCQLFQPTISKVTLYYWTKQGKLKPYRIGRRVFYKYNEVMAALKTLHKYKRTFLPE